MLIALIVGIRTSGMYHKRIVYHHASAHGSTAFQSLALNFGKIIGSSNCKTMILVRTFHKECSQGYVVNRQSDDDRLTRTESVIAMKFLNVELRADANRLDADDFP